MYFYFCLVFVLFVCFFFADINPQFYLQQNSFTQLQVTLTELREERGDCHDVASQTVLRFHFQLFLAESCNDKLN